LPQSLLRREQDVAVLRIHDQRHVVMRDEPRSVLTFVPPAAVVNTNGRRDEVRCSQINAAK
jgi:hypothetical protein